VGDGIVECHSGYAYAERPAALRWESQRLEIIEILSEWRTPGGKCFRVKTEDGRTFELAYIELNDEWTIKGI